MVTATTIACCLIFWWKCLLRYSIKRNEKFVYPFHFRDIKKKSFDENMNVLKHVFINFIFTKLEFLCLAHLIMYWTNTATINYLGGWSCNLSVGSPVAYHTSLSRRPLHFSSAFVLSDFILLFSAPLGYFLLNCGTFIKWSIN